MKNRKAEIDKLTLVVPISVIVIIWAVYFIEINYGFNFNKYGIYPRTFKGLRGIIFSPFIHGSVSHIFNNSIPLAVMLGSLYFFYKKIATKVLLIGIFLTGFLTWIFARPAYHIGASGVVYFLVSFIFFSGIFRKHYRLIALSLVVVFLYGSLIWYVFPVEEAISWEGHLSGFLMGLLFAYLFKKQGPQPEQFIFSKNEAFENQFDENGNFIEQTEENSKEEE
ncbi:rhomboid family intramembrane serine protease [Lutibacter sp.]|uniref:rhomboid family intramembrane serine protease n=1 Tax=Lutibacter sp. TaxID=1925666 RepID=UPI0025C6186D|nr:rhomboid family intramembrane serine protease [Lutibacter sp.]MCF6180786.1 rhomboid family intramembrane serine protease [Lutibacter sp.]